MVYNFNNSKKMALTKNDKSSILKWDKNIASLCEKINSFEDYYTTSSCGGRIVLIKEDEKKLPGLFLFRSHEKVTFDELKSEIKSIIENDDNSRDLIYFKQEPCLVVISCKNEKCQEEMFSLFRNNGWKKSGILTLGKKRIIELMSTETISMPIINNGKVLVDDDFLRILIEEANRKLELSLKKIEKLKKMI